MTLLYAYNFDEASGAVVDYSGSGLNVTLTGSLVRTASAGGHSGTGSDKGLSQSTTAADSAGPTITGLQTPQYTVMAWVKRSSNSVDGWFAELKAGGSGDRGILFSSGAVQSRVRNAAGTVQFVSTTQPTAGTWYHVAGSYSTVDGKIHLYINGTEIGTGVALAAPLKSTSTGSHLFDTLGSETVIDDLRYYDTALDAATITTLMGTPVSGGGGTTPVSATRATTWRVAAQVTSTRATSWDVLTAVSATRVASWDTLARVTSSRVATWDALTSVASTRATTWRVVARVTGTRVATWDVLSGVTATRATTWAVASTLTTVTATRATIWAVKARTTSTRVVIWDTRTVTTSSRVATWDVLTRTTATRVATWDVLVGASATRSTTWRVRARATATRSTTWAVAFLEVPYTPADTVTAVPRSFLSTATARDPEPSATVRQYVSTATVRSPE